ncbi:MAG TPA: endonuclease III [Isosphaeraceae bacterium]|jgi:endonuclease-3 related protein
MPSLDESFPALLTALASRYGRPAAMPREGFAATVAAWLDRAVEGRRVAAVLEGLRDAGLLEPDDLAGADPLEVAEALRGAGVSAPAKLVGPLQRLARWASDRGSVDALDAVPTDRLREELRGLNGIGPASADAILLFGLRRPAFPVDRASFRVLIRHGWLDPSADYDDARSAWERAAGEDPPALARLSSGLEPLGREFCRAGVAKCERCPLKPFLPANGPLEPDA